MWLNKGYLGLKMTKTSFLKSKPKIHLVCTSIYSLEKVSKVTVMFKQK